MIKPIFNPLKKKYKYYTICLKNTIGTKYDYIYLLILIEVVLDDFAILQLILF